MPYNPYYNVGVPQQTPYSNYYMQQPIQPVQPIQPLRQQTEPYKTAIGNLQGKSVDSVDVVKAMDIPYDGSISYFPLTDNSAIITKQLQQDGTSKILIYKPVQENEEKKIEYATKNDINDALKDFNNKEVKDIKDDLKTLKKQLRDLADDIKE